ncbi:hypothetical protein [Bradyrhizobium sp. Ai1a-2]|uniref:hypothetical protein n=1 Tax=Bradyrhizobium sp. Ai1a-2 TaxID=196490 RepID=UPI000480459C|nr:hypothetical protein [Bradyrhizobium sp. Ai1a-2]
MTGSPPHKQQTRSSPDKPSGQEQALHFDTDEALISHFEREAEKGGFVITYVQRMAGALRKLSAWLRTNGRPPMAGRLNQSDADARAYANQVRLDPEDFDNLNRALTHLREAAAGRPVTRLRRGPKPGDHLKAKCVEDDALISRFRVVDLGLTQSTVDVYASLLRRFSDWLHDLRKEPMVGRLHDDTLAQDAIEFNHSAIIDALGWLRLAWPNAALALQSHEQAGSSAAAGSSQYSSWQGPSLSLGACPSSPCSIGWESDFIGGDEQVFSPLED